MVCKEIRELFSEYLDDSLSGEKKALVEEHLSLCEACRQEVASLDSVLRELHTLEPVKPPQDFLDQLHRRMEERSWFMEGLRKLFVPMRIKIPLQLAGTLAVAFLVVSILFLQEPSFRSSKVPSEPRPEPLKEQRTAPTLKDEAPQRPSPPAPQRAPAVTAEPSRAYEKLKAVEPETHREKRIYPRAQSAMTRKPDLEKASVNLVLRMRKPANEGDISSSLTGRSSTTRAAPAAPALGAISQRNLEKKAGVSLLQRVRGLIEDAQGKVLSVEYDKNTGEWESIRAEIPAAQYAHVYDGLSLLGEVQAPAEAPPSEDRGPVDLRITVVEQ